MKRLIIIHGVIKANNVINVKSFQIIQTINLMPSEEINLILILGGTKKKNKNKRG